MTRDNLTVFRGSIRKTFVWAAICACAAFFWLAADAAQRDLPRDALWQVVHNVCVPGETLQDDPKPCAHVDLKSGIESGFAILRDPRAGTQFLLIPTIRISGIESPLVRGPNAANYFASAWENRAYIEKALHMSLPRDSVGLAINSFASRSQDQLHIHFSCVRADVQDSLHKNEVKIGDRWAPLNVDLAGHRYIAMWVPGENLSAHNPFRLLAEKSPASTRDMANHTLVVIGFTRAVGTKGFVLLADEVNKQSGDLANGEELLDNACLIAATGNKSHARLIAPEAN